MAPPQADPMGAVPPVGREDPTSGPGRRKRRRFPLRLCLRQGCGRHFDPRSWNQRYCPDPDCRRKVRQWQDRKRQQRRRSSKEGKKAHREAESRRRKREREAGKPATRERSDRSQEAPRGHGAKGGITCDRPGCYHPVRPSINGQSRYCGVSCRQALRGVLDRERKWLLRKTRAGRFKRCLEFARRSRFMRCHGSESGLSPPGQG